MKLYSTVTLLFIISLSTFAQERGYINDPDGYTNIRAKGEIKSEIVGKYYVSDEFYYYQDDKSYWWYVYNPEVEGYMHKSRIISLKSKKYEIRTFFKEFDETNVEYAENFNERLFEFLKTYPSAFLEEFCRVDSQYQHLILKELESPIHDGFDLQKIYNGVHKALIGCDNANEIKKSLEHAYSKVNSNKLNMIVNDSLNIPKMNSPYSAFSKPKPLKLDTLNGKPISFYLNHPDIDIFSKLYFKGKFVIMDESLSFSIMDSLTTKNNITRPFYTHIFNSIQNSSDGAVAEIMGMYILNYIEKYPCEFLSLYNSELYSNSFGGWVGHLCYELGFDTKDINWVKDILLKQSSEGCDIPEKKVLEVIDTIQSLLEEIEDDY